MKDSLKIHGRVIIEEISTEGIAKVICEGDNLVLTAGLLNVERLLAGHASGKKMAKIGVGTNDAPVTLADTALTSAVIKDIEDVDYNSGNTVAFIGTIAGSDPAMTIREVGLYNQDNVLCHRKVFSPAKIKAAGLSYRITYQIKVR